MAKKKPFASKKKQTKNRPQQALQCVAVSLGLSVGMSAVWANESEIITMPTGRLEADGSLQNGFTYGKPYTVITTQATALPWLQGGFAFTRFIGVPGFGTDAQPEFVLNYGNNRDKSIFGKIKLTDESEWMPAIALYVRDPIGTSLFKGNAIAASKRFGVAGSVLDATLGFGTGRLKGGFAAVSATVPGVQGLKLLVEKDVIDYTRDPFSTSTGLSVVKQPIAYGLNYQVPHSGWEFRLASKMKTTELTLRYALDNHVRDAVPKRKELPRFRAPLIQPTASQWQADAKHAQAMERLLHSYGFEHVELGYDAKHTLSLTLSHPTQLHTSSAVGDAVHIALKAGPSDTKEIALRYLNGETQLAIAQYHFTDISALNAYVKGQIRQSALWPSVRVSDPAVQEASDIKIRAPKSEGEVSQMLTSLGQSAQQTRVHLTQAPDQTFVRQAIDLTSPNSLDDLGLKPRNEGSNWALSPLGLNWNSGGDRDHRVSIYPKLATYLNGPAIFQYSLKLGMQYEGKLADKTYASVIMTKPVVEDIVKLGIGNPKSKLPNVRSRTAFYEANQDVRLDRAVINRFEQLDQNVYGRVNLGFFETAYAGVGAQVLWTPKDVAWAADISIDALAQRDEKQMFASNGYRTLTALASVHYRLPMDVLLTARAGQFLAKDRGVRVEFMRRFWGGIEVGAWASVTNAKDYAFAPGSNYRDKGLAINIPFDSLLENYSRQKASITMQPWTRDAGQMVRNPADLYELLEDDIRSKRVQSGLERFSGVSDYDGQVKMGALGFDEGIVSPAINATRRFATEMRQADLIGMATSGALFTLSAALSDRSLNKWSNKSSPALQTRFNQLGSATSGLTALGLGAAALWAYDGQDWQRSQVALASLEASGAAIVMATGLKYLTARARPSEGLGASSFGNVPRGSSSFLSRHVALASAMVTPLAIHYDAPLLYALPALTALARVGTRKHWASDVAAGGALGFALGNLFYQSHTRADKQRNPVMFNLTKESISITIPTE